MPRKKVIETEVPPIIGMDSGKEISDGAVKAKKKVVLRDSEGRKLTKTGAIDKRAESSLKNLQKSKVYQAIQQAKAAKKAPVIPVVESEAESDDSDDSYEMEELVVKKRSEPQVIEKEVIKEIPVEKIVEKIIEKEDVESKEELKKIKAENAKLKDNFQFNSHLNRISNLAKQVSIKF